VAARHAGGGRCRSAQQRVRKQRGAAAELPDYGRRAKQSYVVGVRDAASVTGNTG